MQRKICVFVLFFVAASPINGLKLLVDENYVEDDDETWESDISFSYKPYQGKCLKPNGSGAGAPVACTKTDAQPGSVPAGWLSVHPCQGAGPSPERDVGGGNTAIFTVRAVDAAKYCESITTVANSKYSAVYTALRAKYIDDKAKGPGIGFGNLKKYVHYVAKLAIMSTYEEWIEDSTATSGSNVVESYNIDVADGTATFFKDAATGGDGADGVLCYTKAGMTWAKNDPIVKNMDGEEFEITATGTFSLLTIKKPESETLFEASTFIDRAGTRCGATYIQNMTLSGQWVEDVGVPRIQIKALAAVPKAKALQVNFNGEWQHAGSQLSSAAVQDANAKMLRLKLHLLGVVVTLDSHRIQEGGMKTKRFANFLNVNFEGISKLNGVSIGGLLGRASHEAAVELPEGCESTKLISTGQESQKKMLSHFEMS